MMLPSDQDASGRTFGDEEIAYVTEALRSGTLTTTKGKFGKMLEKKFAEKFGAKYAYACTSGSAAIHIAVATVNPNPGDEIITTSITDMGALTPLMYRGVVPVFCRGRPQDAECHGRDHRGQDQRPHKGDHCYSSCSAIRAKWARSWNWPKNTTLPVIEDSAQTFLAKCG